MSYYFVHIWQHKHDFFFLQVNMNRRGSALDGRYVFKLFQNVDDFGIPNSVGLLESIAAFS